MFGLLLHHPENKKRQPRSASLEILANINNKQLNKYSDCEKGWNLSDFHCRKDARDIALRNSPCQTLWQREEIIISHSNCLCKLVHSRARRKMIIMIKCSSVIYFLLPYLLRPLHAFHRNLAFFSVNLFLREQINAMNIERGFYVEVINRDFNLSGI